MKIVLASASPRRRELLARMGLEFEVLPSSGEEIITKEVPSEVVMELAKQKAESVAEELMEKAEAVTEELKLKDESVAEERLKQEDDFGLDTGSSTKEEDLLRNRKIPESLLIIGADTIVVNDGKILGKPHDANDACRMLRSLSGKTHQVYTGVCLMLIEEKNAKNSDMLYISCPSEEILQRETLFAEKTDVTFYPMTEDEISAYVATGDPLDKAGAYGIQGICGKYIKGIEGDYNNVVGLPIARLYQEMKKSYSVR